MEARDFYDFKSNISTAKDTSYPILKDVSEVVFKEGPTKIFCKRDHDEKGYKSGEFLTKKFRATILGG